MSEAKHTLPHDRLGILRTTPEHRDFQCEHKIHSELSESKRAAAIYLWACCSMDYIGRTSVFSVITSMTFIFSMPPGASSCSAVIFCTLSFGTGGMGSPALKWLLQNTSNVRLDRTLIQLSEFCCCCEPHLYKRPCHHLALCFW